MQQKDNNTPMVEIFGGIFALLLVLFIIVNLMSEATLLERLESSADQGLYKISWQTNGEGFTVIAFPNELRIIETGVVISSNQLCALESPFVKYVQKIYQKNNQQLIFAVLEQGVKTMALARDCIIQTLPNQKISIGWIIANNELLKSVALQDIPPHIKKVVQ